jgi:DNA-binding NtrC family response regulator
MLLYKLDIRYFITEDNYTKMSLVFVIDDDARQRKLYADTLREAGVEVEELASAEIALDKLQSVTPDMIISDVRMPGMNGITLLRQVRASHFELPFLIITAFADIRDAVKALKLGAVDYLEKPIDLDELLAAVNDVLHLDSKLENDIEIPSELRRNIIVESDIMKVIFRDAYRVAQSDATVLLTGESGTGKEVVSSFIHSAGRRADKQMVTLNCAAIPSTILASELFGHKKGAFTGAVKDRKGIFRESDRGTLFLDEIGDMPLELQPSLLRAIEAGMVSPVGSDSETRVDFRLIAATNTDLEDAVKNGKFREDLFYRLNVISFHIPPIRERRDDIMPLARFFLGRKSLKDVRFSQAAVRVMENYNWPGNARELANAVERAAIISNAEIILPEHLPPVMLKTSNSTPMTATGEFAIKTMHQAEIEAITSALHKVDGNRTKAAKILGISRRALIYKIKRFELK